MAEIASTPGAGVNYRRVPGLRFAGGRSTLRIADDHLLLCDYRTGFTERYKRFYFSDIEALIIRKTMHWIVWMVVWGFVAFCFFLVGLAVGWSKPVLITEGVFILFVLLQALRGPTCRTHIQTAVQVDALPMLRYIRRTTRVTGTIFSLIEQAQGKREETVASPAKTSIPSPLPSTVAVASSEVPVVAASNSPSGQIATVQDKVSALHVVTFVAVMLTGLNAIWEVNYPSSFSLISLVGFFSLSSLCGLIALIRQAKHRVHRGAAVMTWLLMISFVMGGSGLVYVYSMASFVTQTQAQVKAHASPPQVFEFVSPFQMRDMPGFSIVLWSYGIWAVLMGLLGLIFVFIPPPAKTQPPPLPARL